MNTSTWRWILALAALAALASCSRPAPDPTAQGSASIRLTPHTGPVPDSCVPHTVYVPVYSSLYMGTKMGRSIVDLGATVSIRNVSGRNPVILTYARYYDSAGKRVRDYIDVPSDLGALASVEYVIERHDDTGGPGSQFLDTVVRRSRDGHTAH